MALLPDLRNNAGEAGSWNDAKVTRHPLQSLGGSSASRRIAVRAVERLDRESLHEALAFLKQPGSPV
ncbi:MAG TPA: hypothetical protein V6D34_13705 [Candidatus Sericytochromatia bacterium]